MCSRYNRWLPEVRNWTGPAARDDVMTDTAIDPSINMTSYGDRYDSTRFLVATSGERNYNNNAKSAVRAALRWPAGGELRTACRQWWLALCLDCLLVVFHVTRAVTSYHRLISGRRTTQTGLLSASHGTPYHIDNDDNDDEYSGSGLEYQHYSTALTCNGHHRRRHRYIPEVGVTGNHVIARSKSASSKNKMAVAAITSGQIVDVVSRTPSVILLPVALAAMFASLFHAAPPSMTSYYDLVTSLLPPTAIGGDEPNYLGNRTRYLYEDDGEESLRHLLAASQYFINTGHIS